MAQVRKGRIIAVIGKARVVRRIVQTTREISGYRTDFGNGNEEALDVIRNVAPQPALLERLALVRLQGLCRRTGGEENLLDRRQPGLPIRRIHQAHEAHDKGSATAAPVPTVPTRGSQHVLTAGAPQRSAVGNTPAHARRGSADLGGRGWRLDFGADRLLTRSDRVLRSSASGKGDLIIRQTALAVAIPAVSASVNRPPPIRIRA